MPYRGPGAPIKPPPEGPKGDPTYLCCQSFVESVRDGKRPFADEHVGWASAVSVVMANKAVEEGRRLKFSDYVKTSRG
jgi:hypothetical protein